MKRALLGSAVALLLIASVPPLAAQEFPDMTPEKPRPSGPPPNAFVEQPRPYGHVVGDVLTQRIQLQLDGQPFIPGPLPRAERVGAWFERRELRMQSTEDGRRWLIAEFQIINAPEALTDTRIPAWELRPASGQNVLRMPAWPISIAALTPRTVAGEGALEALRPDRAAPLIVTESMERQLTLYVSAFAATLVLWLNWWLWRQWRASSSQPFARAKRAMRKLDETAPQAWLALHRAFDETAGEALQTATLADLFRRAPQFVPLRDRIEDFYAQSNARFFTSGQPGSSLAIRKLCAELRRIEKRHEA